MDSYIDKHEALGYGAFAVTQIKEMVVGIDTNFDGVLSHVGALLASATEALRVTLSAAGELDVTTYTGQAASADDPVAVGRDTLRKLVRYVESRDDGDAIAEDLLGGQTLTTIVKRRPVKLGAALSHAVDRLAHHKAALSEYAAWSDRLSKVAKALDTLNTQVRVSRTQKREMTPAVATARASWLVVYGVAKLQVEAVLKLHGKTATMPEVFDDLAEVHRVPGVTDDGPPAPAPAPAPADPSATG